MMPMNQSNALLDQEQISNLKELFNEGLEEFLKTFMNDFEKKEKELNTVLEDKNLEQAAKIAHSLKGSSANIGAKSLAAACQQLESATKSADLQKSLEEYKSIQIIYPQVKQAFQEIFSHK